jgi:putative ABC transport system substrate-binding protein
MSPHQPWDGGMRRRDFIKAIGTAAAWSLPLAAQEVGRTYRVGLLNPIETFWFVLREQFRRSGFIEGQNLVLAQRAYGQRVERIDDFAGELVKEQPDVIVAGGDFAISAVMKASSTIPVVGFTDDMLGSGFVDSLALQAPIRPESACSPTNSTANGKTF